MFYECTYKKPNRILLKFAFMIIYKEHLVGELEWFQGPGQLVNAG